MRKRFALVLLALIFLAGCGERERSTPPSPGRRVEEYTPRQSFRAKVLQESREIVQYRTSGEVYFKAPDWLRVEMVVEEPPSELVIVYAPGVLWEYDPGSRTVERTDLTALRTELQGLSPFQLTAYLISDVAHPFAAKHRGEKLAFEFLRSETLGGEETRVYEARQTNQEGEEIERVLVWVGEDDGFLRQKVQYLRGKESERELFYEVDINPDLPDALFEFTPPAGAGIIDRTETYRKKLQAELDLYTALRERMK